MLQRLRGIAEQNCRRTFARAPVKRIGWSEQYHLRRSRRAGQMHGRGIHRNKQARVLEQRCQGEKIEGSREIEQRNAQFFADGGDVGALSSLTPPDNTGKRPSLLEANSMVCAQRCGSQNFSARAEPG